MKHGKSNLFWLGEVGKASQKLIFFQLFIQQPSLSIHYVPETAIDACNYHDEQDRKQAIRIKCDQGYERSTEEWHWV